MTDAELYATIEKIENARIDPPAVWDFGGVDAGEHFGHSGECTDNDTCKCRYCREINAGIHDGKAADELTRVHLGNTARDVMPDGKPRFATDLYWQGILTGIES